MSTCPTFGLAKQDQREIVRFARLALPGLPHPPVGEIESDPWVPAGFFSAYDLPGAVQDSIRELGNDYLREHYPQMDSIIGTRVLEVWPS